MATLLRTSNSSAKLVCGFYQNGTSLPQFPPYNKSKNLTVNDSATNFIVTSSLQAHIQRHVNALLLNNNFSQTKGINVTSRRFLHSDVVFPNFDKYRREDTLDPYKSSSESFESRKAPFTAIFYGVGGMLSMIAAREVAQTLVYYKAMAADQKALASIEIDLNEIPEGKTKAFEWRGKPVFVRHRTLEEIQKERETNVAELRHPETDQQRVKKDEWSIVIGICTHLGCVPIANSGDFGGYYCPCHGSHYDMSGRIRKGPAPLNLNVPDYVFKDETTVIVGSG